MEWNKKEIDKTQVKQLSESLHIPLLAASIFVRRGVTDPEELKFYLEKDLRYLHNPFLFNEMEDAVDRILQAAVEEEKVIIMGDRDVDGITSTVILKEALALLGINALWSLPLGDEPYGVTLSAVESFARQDGTLMITVDCGISNIKEIARAAELGIDTIVIDHHLPSPELPPAVAIINPKISDSGYPFEHLAGCGVTLKLVSALTFGKTNFYKEEVILLNVSPGNETYMLEAVRFINMVELDRVSENIVPGLVRIEQTRLKDFLIGKQIFVYDKNLQIKMLKKIFGQSVEIGVYDLATVLWKEFPVLQGKSLLALREKSRSSLYSAVPPGELDVLIHLFITYLNLELQLKSSIVEKSLDLVALGTLADMMPLINENRILVQNGMNALNRAERKGLQALLLKQNLLGKKISTTDVGWQITPVINATGRMGEPGKAAELFLTTSLSDRERLAGEIIEMNKARKKLGESIWNTVLKQAEKHFEEMDSKMVLVIDRKIKRGITGIIASRLVSYFGVPAMVIAYLDSHLVGSMRSVNGFKVKNFLSTFSDLFIDYGGHDFAAGFSLKEINLERFLFAVKTEARKTAILQKVEESISVDAELPLNYLNPELIKTVEKFEPYGERNPPLIFLTKGLKVVSIDIVGRSEQQHAKLLFDSGKYKWPGIFWRAAERVGVDFSVDDTVDIVFRLGRNYFQNTEILQLTILDIRRSGE